MAGHELGTHEADERCRELIITASPFAPPKLMPVTRFSTIDGLKLDCVFNNAGRRGDIVVWDGETIGKNGEPSKTCHAINEKVIGELEKDALEGGIGNVQLYKDAGRLGALP